MAGDRTEALRGLGTIKATADIGGFVAYEHRHFNAKIDVRQATNSDLGLNVTLSMRYSAMIPLSADPREMPVIISAGPRVTFVDDNYNRSYFGITPQQSSRTGLDIYRPDGGLLSAGVGASAIIPLGKNLSMMVVTGYDRLGGDAAKSPLVEERGSRDQFSGGLGLTYRFGL